jgi:hypothetical protein
VRAAARGAAVLARNVVCTSKPLPRQADRYRMTARRCGPSGMVIPIHSGIDEDFRRGSRIKHRGGVVERRGQ